MDLTSVEGIIEGIIYKNEANGYTVCEIASGRKLITAVGYMPFINEGETIKANGRWVRHPDYGDQFKVELYEKVLPHTAEAIEKYLASGIVKGVGPVTAKKIVDRFGASALDVISNEPERLSEIKGISLAKAMDIGRALNEQRGLQDVVMFLQEYGISPSACVKIHRRTATGCGHDPENPYRLCEDVFGIGFKTADMIAMKLGVDPASFPYKERDQVRAEPCGFKRAYVSAGEHAEAIHGPPARDPGHRYRGCAGVLIFDKAVQTEKTAEDSNVYLSAFTMRNWAYAGGFGPGPDKLWQGLRGSGREDRKI